MTSAAASSARSNHPAGEAPARESGPSVSVDLASIRSAEVVTQHDGGCGDYRSAGFKPVTALGITAQVAVCECGAFWLDHPEAWV